MGCHAMDQGRGEVDVKDRKEEDHVDGQSNQEEGDHIHFDCQHQAGSAEQLQELVEVLCMKCNI